MLSYGLFFALAGFAVRDTARACDWRRLGAIGAVVPFFALTAASFDASENLALLLTLSGNGGSFAPPFAAVCAAFKFTLIYIAILYALCGLGLWLRARFTTVRFDRANPTQCEPLCASRWRPDGAWATRIKCHYVASSPSERERR
jgi:hypothetical protein